MGKKEKSALQRQIYVATDISLEILLEDFGAVQKNLTRFQT